MNTDKLTPKQKRDLRAIASTFGIDPDIEDTRDYGRFEVKALIEQLQAENAALKARLEAIEQAAAPMVKALKRLHRYIDDSCVLEVETVNPDWIERRENKCIYLELQLDGDGDGESLRIGDLKALVKAIKDGQA